MFWFQYFLKFSKVLYTCFLYLFYGLKKLFAVVFGLIILFGVLSVFLFFPDFSVVDPVNPASTVSTSANSLLVMPESVDDSGSSDSNIWSVASSNNKFAFDFYEVANEDANMFFSPYSISSALALTYEGAGSKTASQIQEVFYFPKKDVLRPGFAGIYNILNSGDKSYELSSANALWAEKSYGFDPDYFSVINQFYGGRVNDLDFVNSPEESRKVINEWVSINTNGKIENLLKKRFVSSDTRLVLTNAVYFRGDWASQFDEGLTTDYDFVKSDGSVVKVPMMKLFDSEFDYFENDVVEVLKMDYEGGDLSMFVLLPKEDLVSLESVLSYKNFDSWSNSVAVSKVDVFFPKFKLESEYDLLNSLTSLGMPLAFDSGKADFSGMTGSRGLFISSVVHKGFVEVNEQGTEAAAATGVGMGVTSVDPNPPKQFIANHPFIFVIKDNNSGSVLFMGKVVDPS